MEILSPFEAPNYPALDTLLERALEDVQSVRRKDTEYSRKDARQILATIGARIGVRYERRSVLSLNDDGGTANCVGLTALTLSVAEAMEQSGEFPTFNLAAVAAPRHIYTRWLAKPERSERDLSWDPVTQQILHDPVFKRDTDRRLPQFIAAATPKATKSGANQSFNR